VVCVAVRGGRRTERGKGSTRHGLNFQKSSFEPGAVCWFVVRYRGSSTTAGSVGLGSPGQWSKFGILDPFPVPAAAAARGRG